MSNFLFENVLLGVGVQAASAVYEWEGASLVPAAGGLAALSFEFFFSYFNVFTALVVLSPAADVIADAYVSQAVGALVGGVGPVAAVYALQGALVGAVGGLFSPGGRSFLGDQFHALVFFGDVRVVDLCGDWAKRALAAYVVTDFAGVRVATVVTSAL